MLNEKPLGVGDWCQINFPNETQIPLSGIIIARGETFEDETDKSRIIRGWALVLDVYGVLHFCSWIRRVPNNLVSITAAHGDKDGDVLGALQSFLENLRPLAPKNWGSDDVLKARVEKFWAEIQTKQAV